MQLESERLIIRELTLDDHAFIAEMLADAEVMRFWPRPLDSAEALDWIESHIDRYSSHDIGYWLAVEKCSGNPVGQVGLLVQEFDGQGHLGLGYMLHRPFWGKGLAFEGSVRCLQHAFDALREEQVIALIQPANEPSRRLALRLGFEVTGQTTYKEILHDVHSLNREKFSRDQLSQGDLNRHGLA